MHEGDQGGAAEPQHDAAASADVGGSTRAPDPDPGGWRRPSARGARVVASILLVVVGVVGAAVLAGGVGRSSDGSGPSADPTPLGEALDAVIMAALTLGLALTIAVFIVQFGGPREERDRNAKRRLLGLLLVAPLLAGTIWVVQQLDLSPHVEIDAPAEEQEAGGDAGGGIPGGIEAEEQQDRSPVGSWVGLTFALLLLGVGAAWMWAERRRQLAEAMEAAGPADERDQLAGLLDLAIDDLRADPDPRRAVIRAWASLGAALASVGLPRHEAEAPFPYLHRALGALETSGPAATRLTAAFETAMFSTHVVDRAAQDEAVDALAAVRDELRIGVER